MPRLQITSPYCITILLVASSLLPIDHCTNQISGESLSMFLNYRECSLPSLEPSEISKATVETHSHSECHLTDFNVGF